MKIYIMLMFTVILGLCSIWANGLQAVPPEPTETPTLAPTSEPTPDMVQVSVGQPFTLSLQQQAALKDNLGGIVFDAVLNDSRCPATAECITAGSVQVEVSVNGQTYTLTLGDMRQGDVSSVVLDNGLTLELLKVNPYPGSRDDTPDAVETIQLVISE